MRNVLVTGATGFLGPHLCRELEARGDRVVGVKHEDTDLRVPGSLASFDGLRYDVIYHLATWTQAGDFCLRHAGDQWVTNQWINTNVVNWWCVSQPQAKFVAMGSSCAYPLDRPLVEGNFMEGSPTDSLYAYAMTKRMLYAGLKAVQKQYGLHYLYLVPSTLYGNGFRMHGRQLHFIFDLIRKIVAGRYDGEPVVLWGDGLQKRELLHVGDFVRAMLSLNDTTSDEMVNVGTGTEYSIREFAEVLCRLIGYDAGRIQYDAARYVGATSKVLDISRLRALLPGFRARSLEAGLSETVEWYLQTLGLS